MSSEINSQTADVLYAAGAKGCSPDWQLLKPSAPDPLSNYQLGNALPLIVMDINQLSLNSERTEGGRARQQDTNSTKHWDQLQPSGHTSMLTKNVI